MKKIDVRWFGKKASVGLSGSLIALTLAHSAAAQESPSSGGKQGNAADAPTLPPVQVRATSGLAQDDNVNDPDQVVGVSKTGTALKDLPASVQVIPRALLTEQGATMLRQGVSNASGVNVGGQDSKGYYDHFLIRGLNAQIYNDGFSDGDLLGGISHSLNGVERIEVLEGPGSALFGSGPPGGTINIVHYTPSSDFHFGGNIESGSYGTVSGSAYVTGPTGISGLNYRVDATVSRSDGFRDLASRDEEIRPAFEWKLDNHKINFSLDARDIHETPDSYGLIYFHGSPITNVSIDSKYSTPFAFARGNYVRPTLTDEWKVSDILTINNRFSYLHRSLDVLGNGDSTSTKISGDEVVGRQLRQQDDSDNSFDYQLEPVWRFATGSVKHTLLTGFEYQHQTIDTERTTADLPNIPNAFAPVPPETSLAGLTFLCDAKHSCDNDHLLANYYSVYATDQIDVTDKLKIRAGVRKDWWDTSLTPNITVPGRFDTEGQPLVAGVTDTRNDAPVSWNIGVLYKALPWMSPYFGVSRSHLANFNSENTQNGIGAPESALQYEVGVKFSFLDDRYVLNTALFDVERDNVASLTTINNVESVVFDSQRTKGAEASLDASITSQWHVVANFTAQDAKITDNPQGVTSVGNHPQGAPAYMANLWTLYNFSIAGVPGFHVGAGVNYVSKTYSDITNVNSIPSYVIVNAAVGYEAPKWGIDLNVHNLTDRRYFIAANAAGAYVGESLSAFVNVHANF
ncbi:TonB-dependent receptor [Paraburkholderia fungorum]|uniref:TonB-dependent receptor n=1 Tax=Paraburkholderia fungorum TaxID=134537 RepID=UPI0038B76596